MAAHAWGLTAPRGTRERFSLKLSLRRPCSSRSSLAPGWRSRDAIEGGPELSETRPCHGAETAPRRSTAQNRRNLEVIGAQNIFDKHADRTGEFVQGIVKRDHSARQKVLDRIHRNPPWRRITMVAINPQKAYGTIPSPCNVRRIRAMNLDQLSHPSRVEIVEKFVVGGSIGAGAVRFEFNVVEVVRIDGNDRPQSVMRGHFGQCDGGLAFEAADLDDGSGARDTCGNGTQQSRLALTQEPWNGFGRFHAASRTDSRSPGTSTRPKSHLLIAPMSDSNQQAKCTNR